jgi:hypothetical protein
MASVLQGGGHSHPLARTVHACCRSRAVQAFQCPGAMSNSCNEMNIKESHGSDQACGFPVAPHLPLEQPGSGDAGGMNGYTRSLATALADFDLTALVRTAGMDDVVTHLPPVAAPQLAGWYRSADVVVMRPPTANPSVSWPSPAAHQCRPHGWAACPGR